jgi:hypothetical protein
MPPEQPFGGERLAVVARGVYHHFDDAFDVAVPGLEGADVYAQAPGYRRADLLGIELLPFDFAALENIRGKRLQDSFLLEIKSQRFHVPDQAALPVTDGGKGLGEVCPRSSGTGANL